MAYVEEKDTEQEMNELYEAFRRNFPFAVRNEATAREILSFPDNIVLRENGGTLVLNGNTVLMLCVDEECRRKGIGSRLLLEAEDLVRNAGYDRIVIGAGRDYLTPGVPMRSQAVPEYLRQEQIDPRVTDDACRFFMKRGYRHAWDCNCFDMRADLSQLPEPDAGCGGIVYRIADERDIADITECTESAEPGFTGYYRDPLLYSGKNGIVLAAEADGHVRGALMVMKETEETGTGSIGCTIVHSAYQGRGIASRMVMLGARYLKDAGLGRGFLGYTYSGLDRLYGRAGYRISVYYLMAEKRFS